MTRRELHIDVAKMGRAIKKLRDWNLISVEDSGNLMNCVYFWNDNAGKVFCNHKFGEIVK